MIEKIALHPSHLARLIELRNKIYTKIGEFAVEGAYSNEPAPYSIAQNLTYTKVSVGTKWADKQFGCAWFKLKGRVDEKRKGKKIVALIDINGEGLVYIDGKIKQGITQVMSGIDIIQSRKGKQVIELFKCAEGGEELDIMVDAGFNLRGDLPKIRRVDIAICNDEIMAYYYDYLELVSLMLTYGKNENITKERVEEISKALSHSYKVSKKDYVKAHTILDAVINTPNDTKVCTYTAIGHAHIDLAWLWPIRETKRKAARTFATAITNIEKYPHYIFGASQAQLFQWIKDDYPELYEKVKQAVKDGRIEIQGGMWTECDCNIPSGESLIRQFYYGNEFFDKEFGIKPKAVWLPDVFGYPACLPQIMKGCDKDYFMTIKLIWIKNTTFPYRTFNWKGVDGTSVLAHMAPLGDYNATASPFSLVNSDRKNFQKKDIDKALMIYGIGDGGGGPGEAHLELLARQKDNKGLSKTVCRKEEEFFAELDAEYKNVIPDYKGELYFESHQGTYTSQARSKLFNRLIENELHNVEWLGAQAILQGISYDRAKIDEIWKEVLLYQFHDVIPGSSIKRVYDESLERYQIMHGELISIRDDLVTKLGCADYLCGINQTSFKRNEYFKYKDKWYNIQVEPYDSAPLIAVGESEYQDIKAYENGIENDCVKVVFNEKGEIISLVDKASGKEFCKDYLNRLIVFTDPKTHYNAWDIRKDYRELKRTYPKLVEHSAYTDGVQSIRVNKYIYGNSKIIQKISLTKGSKMVDIDCWVDWKESFKMLRAEFEPTVYSDTVNCDIQFGNIDRSTLNDTPANKAQFEICAHKFVNVDDDKYGIAIINNCKYGYHAKNGIISLNLLRSPKYPDPTCDMCEHRFSYAIYLHEGSWKDCDLVPKAYAYNNPLLISDIAPKLDKIINIDKDNIIVETIKLTPDGKGITVRLYERYGEHTLCNVTMGFKAKAVLEANLMEERNEGIYNSELEFNAYEIKTIILDLPDKILSKLK